MLSKFYSTSPAELLGSALEHTDVTHALKNRLIAFSLGHYSL